MKRLFKLFTLRARKKRKRKPSLQYLSQKEKARSLVHERLTHFNQFYGFSYNKVFIKNQKTRWGSCSSTGNLNFSYRIIFLSPEARDYVIVHELCHLKEFNHSQKFWDLVVQQIPNYQKLHHELLKGSITESGTHDVLLEQKGLYSAVWR